MIEDDRRMSKLIAQLLSALEFDVVKVSSGEAATKFLQSSSVDLIMLDLRLPGQSGEDWLAAFRLRDAITPVIAVSAVIDPARKASVLLRGADDYVTKPFDISEFEARVRTVMRRPRNSDERTILDGTVRLNPARAEVRVGDVRQSLTICEFGIIWYLASREGQWVDASRLSEVILGDSTPANVESTRVHVCHVRQKLEPWSHLFAIETARMRGYRIVKGWE